MTDNLSDSQSWLVTGGARSGKSTFAEQLAHALGGDDVVMIATAEALDDEMRARIARHRAARPPGWVTVEAPRDWLGALAKLTHNPRVVLFDCLTLGVTNEMLAVPPEQVDDAELERDLTCALDMLVDWAHLNVVDLIVVTNEVGWGIVPENALARRFQDLLGRVNAHVAARVDKVILMVAGQPLTVKDKGAAERGGTECEKD